MYNLIQADLFKLRKSISIKILFVITTVSAVAMTLIAYMIPQGKIDSSMTGIGFMFSDVNVISILGGVIAGIIICADFDNKIIHDAIAQGCSRGTVIASKAIVLCCTLAFILLPYAIVTGIGFSTGHKFSMGSVAIGFLHILTTDGATAISASGICKLFIVMLTLIIVYAAQLSICIPLAIVLKKPVLVVPIYYGISLLSAQLMRLKGKSIVFDGIFDCTPFGGNYEFATLKTGAGDIFKAIAVSLFFIAVMLVITYLGFRKSEIK